MSTTSLLQTALQNLHVSQQARDPSLTPQSLSVPPSPRPGRKGLRPTRSGDSSPPSSVSGDEARSGDGDGDVEGDGLGEGEGGGEGDEEEGEMVKVGRGTAPGTPVPGRGLVLGQRLPRALGGKVKDPLRTLPTHIAVRIYLLLDVKSLSRCDRVCKRWHKSSTLNYVWFLQNRALLLPVSLAPTASGKLRKTGDDTPDYFDPYDKTPRLAALPAPPMPTSQTPTWSKAESKKRWKTQFQATLKRSDTNPEDEFDPLRVNIESLHSSGYTTPSGSHQHAGAGSGGAAKWANSAPGGSGNMTPTERKLAAREGYKALGGRKARGKRRMAGELGTRDRGGAIDDGRFDAPW